MTDNFWLWLKYKFCKTTFMTHQNIPGGSLMMLSWRDHIVDMWYITQFNVVWQLDVDQLIALFADEDRSLSHAFLISIARRQIGHT